MAKTENLLEQIARIESETGIPRTIFAACPNSVSVVRAAFRAAKRNNAPIYFAATLNQIDCDGGYTGLTPAEFVRLARIEAETVNFTGPAIIAIDHGGPWLKDKQSIERWSAEDAMAGVKKSFEAAVEAGYDLIHVDPTVDIYVPNGEIIDIRVVVERTVELIAHVERFRRAKGLPAISYEVGTEEVHGGLADQTTFDRFLTGLKEGLQRPGWPTCGPASSWARWAPTCTPRLSIPMWRGTLRPGAALRQLHQGTLYRRCEQSRAISVVRMGAANVGPEFTMSEYDALAELEVKEQEMDREGRVAQLSHITDVLKRLVCDSNRWRKWLHGDEAGRRSTP